MTIESKIQSDNFRVEDINEYVLGHSAALDFIQEDKSLNDMKTRKFYLELAITEFPYDQGWVDGVNYFFDNQ